MLETFTIVKYCTWDSNPDLTGLKPVVSSVGLVQQIFKKRYSLSLPFYHYSAIRGHISNPVWFSRFTKRIIIERKECISLSLHHQSRSASPEAPRGIRTHNLLITSELRFQLRHGGKCRELFAKLWDYGINHHNFKTLRAILWCPAYFTIC